MDAKGIKDFIQGGGITFSRSADDYNIKINTAGTNCLMQFNLQNGKHLQILTLTREQAMESWKATLRGKEHLIVSPDDLIVFNDSLRLQSIGNGTFEWSVYPSVTSIKSDQRELPMQFKDGVFSRYTLKLPEEKYKVFWKEDTALAGKLAMAVPQRVKGADSTAFSMPLYGAKLQSVPNAKYYVVTVLHDFSTKKNISNAFLKIDYTGDTQAAYLNGNLIADDFYYGAPMTIALKPLAKEMAGNQITLLVTPQPSDRKVFFETKAKYEPANKADLRHIEIVPQYQVFLTLGSKQ